MPIEYSGYVQAPQVDWSALSGKLAKSFTDVGAAKVARREELDKIASDNINKINQIEQGKSQTFQTMILDFQDGGRNRQNDWNKQLKAGTMTSAEYKKRTANLSDYTNILASSAKTLDEKINTTVQREVDGVATDWEMEMLKETGSMAEIRDSKFIVSDDGSIMWAKVDPETGAIIGEPKDVRTPNLPQNMVDNKIIVTDFVKDATKNWETVQLFKDLGGGAYTDFTSVKNHKDANGKSIYNEMAAKVAVAATSSPRATLSILADNGVIVPIYYWNEDEKKAAIAQRYAEIEEVNRVAGNPLEPTEEQKKLIEISLVKKGIDPDGTYNPQLTDAQVKLAQDHVLGEVDMQMKETMDARGKTVFAQQNNNNNNTDDDGIAGWQLSQSAFSSTVPIGANSKSDNTGVLTSLATKNPGLVFKKVRWSTGKEGIAVFRTNDKGQEVPVANILNARDLATYIYGTGNTDKALNTWDRANTQQGGGGSTTPTISNGNVR